MKKAFVISVLALASLASSAFAQNPFSVSASLAQGESGEMTLSVNFAIPDGHYLYADRIAVAATDGTALQPKFIPPAKKKHDTFTDTEAEVYTHNMTFTYALPKPADGSVAIDVQYQGCSESLCFRPITEHVTLSAGAGLVRASSLVPASVTTNAAPAIFAWPEALRTRFTIAGRTSGYVAKDDFLRFLDRSTSGAGTEPDRLVAVFTTRGMWFGLLAILVLGLALNLTPCVLPMIPVNLAIIGAGAQAGSRRRGFGLGATYGAGIAVVYGALGVAVILTGTRFGALNSLPWFNFAVAGVFLLMALAMFDLIHVDFSRFQPQIGQGRRKQGSFVAAFLMGGMAALLAGACVAPVVISVLLMGTNLYASGQMASKVAGLVLPFVLGLGMALPWPFAGAGMAFLPKPGRWMQRVKVGFGVIILLAAAWYAHLAVSLMRNRLGAGLQEGAAAAQMKTSAEGWHTTLDEALQQATAEHKPVMIDFWASWCKNCLKMEATTFQDVEVTRRLNAMVKVKVRAEDMTAPATKAVLDAFGVDVGLPTYVVLLPVPAEDAGRP